MPTSWFEILALAAAVACTYVAYRLCREGYGLLRLARVRLERRIARVLIALGYLLGILVVLAAVVVGAEWL